MENRHRDPNYSPNYYVRSRSQLSTPRSKNLRIKTTISPRTETARRCSAYKKRKVKRIFHLNRSRRTAPKMVQSRHISAHHVEDHITGESAVGSAKIIVDHQFLLNRWMIKLIIIVNQLLAELQRIRHGRGVEWANESALLNQIQMNQIISKNIQIQQIMLLNWIFILPHLLPVGLKSILHH